jgi:hypothetical protein
MRTFRKSDGEKRKGNIYTYYAAGHTDHNIADGVELTFNEERSNKKSKPGYSPPSVRYI